MKFCQALIGAHSDAYVRLAVAAEEAGFDSVALSDHIAMPKEIESKYPYTPDGKPQFDESWGFPDPWIAMGAIGAATTTLEFFTNIFVLPARNPFLVAKALSTVSAMVGPRVSLGIGVGWMREEFELVGQPFAQRGKRADEMIEVIAALMTGESVEYHGEHYDFGEVQMSPAAAEKVPVLVGGDSEIALRRAARNDGWIGVYYSLDELQAKCERVEELRRSLGRENEPFEIVASPMAIPDASTVERLEGMGVTTLLTSAWMAAGKDAEDTDVAERLIGSYGERFIAPLR